jgi:hypothetical protein
VDDEERAARIETLSAKFAEAGARKAALVREVQAVKAKLGEIRAEHGNPYFYSGRAETPENAGESVAKYTGYKSHEPGLRIVRDLLDADRELTTVREQLRALEAGGE